jgi:hypothetical protein
MGSTGKSAMTLSFACRHIAAYTCEFQRRLRYIDGCVQRYNTFVHIRSQHDRYTTGTGCSRQPETFVVAWRPADANRLHSRTNSVIGGNAAPSLTLDGAVSF